jgi:hypothetical protein
MGTRSPDRRVHRLPRRTGTRPPAPGRELCGRPACTRGSRARTGRQRNRFGSGRILGKRGRACLRPLSLQGHANVRRTGEAAAFGAGTHDIWQSPHLCRDRQQAVTGNAGAGQRRLCGLPRGQHRGQRDPGGSGAVYRQHPHRGASDDRLGHSRPPAPAPSGPAGQGGLAPSPPGPAARLRTHPGDRRPATGGRGAAPRKQAGKAGGRSAQGWHRVRPRQKSARPCRRLGMPDMQ